MRAATTWSSVVTRLSQRTRDWPDDRIQVLPGSREAEVIRQALESALIKPTVLAFLFAPPDCDAMRTLDLRGDYFDERTGDSWDLFFPGYYYRPGARPRDAIGARQVGSDYTGTWFFDPHKFNKLRKQVELSSSGRWEYSGGTDLVLINAYVPARGEPTIDWPSTVSGQVTDLGSATHTLTLSQIIERISRDLENALEDPSYGVYDVTHVDAPIRDHKAVRDFMIEALGGIAAALGARSLGG